MTKIEALARINEAGRRLREMANAEIKEIGGYGELNELQNKFYWDVQYEANKSRAKKADVLALAEFGKILIAAAAAQVSI